MRKKLIALAMAAAMVVLPVNTVSAEGSLAEDTEYTVVDGDLIVDDTVSEDTIETEETIGESVIDMENEDPAAGTGMTPGTDVDQTEFRDENSLAEGEISVSSIEEVDTGNYICSAEKDESYGEVTEVMTETETVSECGWAYYAELPVLGMFSISGYQGSYGAQLSGPAKEIYDAMKSAYVDQRSTANISVTFTTPIVFETDYTVAAVEDQETGEKKLSLVAYDKNENYKSSMIYAVQAAYDAFVYDYPEVFWISAMKYQVSIAYTAKEGMHTGALKIPRINILTNESYAGAFQEISAFDVSVNSAVAEIRQGLPADASASYPAKRIMEYLCERLSYKEGETADARKWAHSAAGVFLKDKNVVCEGYAKAYKILCSRFGIECVLVPGRVGTQGEAHMWNYVCLGSNWYLVDVTWADTANNKDKYFLSGSSELAGENRVVSTNFSGADYTQIFVLPEINVSRCSDSEPEYPHIHVFKSYVYHKDATCTSDGTQTARCAFGCGATDTVAADGTMLDHNFIHYVSNQDAGWYQDGTKTALCENGCGTKNTVADSGSAKIPTVSLNATSLVLKKGQSTTALKVSNLAEGDRVVSWKSANTKIVRVNSKTGKITAQKKTGKTKITVTLLSGLTKSITVKVQSSAVKTTKISGVSKKLTVQKGKKVKLAPVIAPITSREKVTYSSSNKKVAAVSSKGVITAKASGKARITVKSGSKKVTVTVTVPKITAAKITGVSQTITLKRNQSKTLKPRLYPVGSEDTIQYTSSNKAVASVSSKGKITARKKGTAVITIKAGKAVAKCKVTVK